MVGEQLFISYFARRYPNAEFIVLCLAWPRIKVVILKSEVKKTTSGSIFSVQRLRLHKKIRDFWSVSGTRGHHQHAEKTKRAV
jgi:hypothetical protein